MPIDRLSTCCGVGGDGGRVRPLLQLLGSVMMSSRPIRDDDDDAGDVCDGCEMCRIVGGVFGRLLF